MGTHPIFESDFDCLTDLCAEKNSNREKMFFVALFAASVSAKASVSVTSQQVQKNEPVTMECTFSGFTDSNLKVRWMFKSADAPDENNQLYKFGPAANPNGILDDGMTFGWSDVGNHAIRVNSAEPMHTGKYTCVVEDGGDNFGMDDGELTVLVPPSKPEITSPSDHKLILGQAAELICESAQGTPTPKYEWFKINQQGQAVKLPFDARNDQKNYPNSTFTLTETDTVKFLTVVENDQGEYYCTASNSAGTAVGEATMISIGSVSVASVVAIVFGVIFGVALLGVLGYILVTKLAGGETDSQYADSEVFEDGQADVMIGENYAMPTGSKSMSNRQEQSLVV